MKVYADANFLVRFYLDYQETGEAEGVVSGHQESFEELIPVPPLLRYEVVNALNRLVFEARTSGQWRVTPEIAAVSLGYFFEDLKGEELLRPRTLPWRDLDPHFEALVCRYTQSHGFRTYDIIHVATALALGCDTFWSFDQKARKLANLQGLVLNPLKD